MNRRRVSSPLNQILSVAAALAVAFAIDACTTVEKSQPPHSGDPTSTVSAEKSYEQLIEKNSDGQTQYAGFYNNFEYKATIMNSSIRMALLDRQANYYQWDDEKRKTEREKMEKDAASETTIFLSFYTPDRKNDNLTESKTIWRLYLEVGGKRYQGKVKKVRSLLAELQALYPYHTRWNTPYTVSFPVPANAVETQNSSLTVTGPLGTRSVSFNAIP